MISKEVYEILHEIDGSPDWMTRHLNWGKVSSDDPRLVKIRALIAASEATVEKQSNKYNLRYKYDDHTIAKLLKQGKSCAKIAHLCGISEYAMRAHIKSNKNMNKIFKKVRYEYKTIIAIKNCKVQSIGTVKELSKSLGLKSESISERLSQRYRLYGYKFIRLKDWRKQNEI